MVSWNVSDIPSQRGCTAIVTGTGGLGLESALALARAGAQVLIAGRSASKGAAAVAHIRAAVPDAQVQFAALDLADLGAVRAFGRHLRETQPKVDLLVNNAGVMTPPRRQLTADGFELQFGTNHLGHFALTAELLPLLRRAEGARVVTLSSIAARNGAIDFDDLIAERRYRPMQAYSQSKLACLMFALELQRRSAAGGWGVESIAAHPGVTRTDLIVNGAGAWSAAGLARRGLWFMFQPAAQGALPTLYAATSPEARGGTCYGPDGFGELRGYPAPARMPAQALDASVSARLWAVSQRLTGAAYP